VPLTTSDATGAPLPPLRVVGRVPGTTKVMAVGWDGGVVAMRHLLEQVLVRVLGPASIGAKRRRGKARFARC